MDFPFMLPFMFPFFFVPLLFVFVLLAVRMAGMAVIIIPDRMPMVIGKGICDWCWNDYYTLRLVIIRDVDDIQYDASPIIDQKNLVVIVNIPCAPRFRWQQTGQLKRNHLRMYM